MPGFCFSGVKKNNEEVFLMSNSKFESEKPRVIVILVLVVLLIAGMLVYRYVSKPASPYRLAPTQAVGNTGAQEYVNAKTGSKYLVSKTSDGRIIVSGDHDNIPVAEQWQDEDNISKTLNSSQNNQVRN
jgi:hypothetical protein